MYKKTEKKKRKNNQVWARHEWSVARSDPQYPWAMTVGPVDKEREDYEESTIAEKPNAVET